MFTPKNIFMILMMMAITYGGILLFFVISFEAAYFARRKKEGESDKRAEMGPYLFTVSIILNFINFVYPGLYEGSAFRVHFLQPFVASGSILLLLATFAVSWGRQRILLQFASVFLIVCEAALFTGLLYSG